MQLAELEYDHMMHAKQYAGDDKLYVRFFMDILPDVEASKATGLRKFRDAEMIQIMVPGSKSNIVIREVRTTEKGTGDDDVRFAKLYSQFKAGQGEVLDGYPLKEWPLVNRAMAEELKYLGFVTVEHVAKATDGVIGKHPGLRDLQERAKIWLEAQAGAAPAERLQSELKARDEQIAALQAQMAEILKAQKAK